MRYRNDTGNPVYCAEAGCVLNPGSVSRELASMADILGPVLEAKRRWTVLLSQRDAEVLMSLLEPPPEARRQEPDSGYNPAYGSYDRARKARNAEIDRAAEIGRAMAERINSESVYFGPDGRPLAAEESIVNRVKEAAEVKPKVVEDPMSALDILSHNAAMTRIRAEQPLTGQEAVAARRTPGMPTLPGSEDSERVAAMEVADSMKGGESFNTRYGPNVTSTKDIETAAEARNYGRK